MLEIATPSLGRMPRRCHFTKRVRTASGSHWLIRKFVELSAVECATREFVAKRAGYSWHDLYRWEAGATMPPIASIEACFSVLGRQLVVYAGRKRLEIPEGTGHWSRRALRAVRHAAGLTQEQLAERIGRNKGTVRAWEAGCNGIPVDGFCAALSECGHRLVVLMVDEVGEVGHG